MHTQTSTDAAGGSRVGPESSNVSAMTAAPTVSVIIAAFNAERHIGAALAAALGQTGVASEAVVADSASQTERPRSSPALATRAFASSRLERNSGPGAARNAACSVPDWFAVLDADDSMAPGRIAALLGAALAGGADIVADNLWVERDDKRTLFIDEALDGGSERLDFADYVANNRLFGGRAYGYLKPMFRAAFLRENALAYEPRLRIGEDFQIVAEMLARGAVYLRRRSADYVYAARSGSTSHRLSAGDAQAIAEADQRFLAAHGATLSHAAHAAMRVRRRSFDEGGVRPSGGGPEGPAVGDRGPGGSAEARRAAPPRHAACRAPRAVGLAGLRLQTQRVRAGDQVEVFVVGDRLQRREADVHAARDPRQGRGDAASLELHRIAEEVDARGRPPGRRLRPGSPRRVLLCASNQITGRWAAIVAVRPPRASCSCPSTSILMNVRRSSGASKPGMRVVAAHQLHLGTVRLAQHGLWPGCREGSAVIARLRLEDVRHGVGGGEADVHHLGVPDVVQKKVCPRDLAEREEAARS